MASLEHLSLTQTIEKINELINSGNGDTGRLFHILEFLKKKKPLYHSDQIYLESKLNSTFAVEDDIKNNVEDNFSQKINQLIENGIGDLGRLQHISDMISDNKQLYNSDIQYLQSKLSSDHVVIEKVKPAIVLKLPEIQPTSQKISKVVKTDLSVKNSEQSKINIRGSMPKGWTSTNAVEELDVVSKKIKDEKEKIQQQEKISDTLNFNKLKLTELVTHRKEYEQKVSQEKQSLESQIKDERLNIATQTKLSQDIVNQQEELEKVKKARTIVIKKINSEKSKITKDLLHQKKQLVEAQLEQEHLEKQIETERTLLAKMTDEQKSQLIHQAKIASEIKLKKIELEKMNYDYEDILSQIKEEQTKITESQKIQSLIKSQEDELIKAKEERLELVNTISQEKLALFKMNKEEQAKLKSQNDLIKKLKKDEKAFDLLKKKREKIDLKIKSKNVKLKEKQAKLKKQIDEKNKKLKSIGKSTKINAVTSKVSKTKPKSK